MPFLADGIVRLISGECLGVFVPIIDETGSVRGEQGVGHSQEEHLKPLDASILVMNALFQEAGFFLLFLQFANLPS